MIKIIEDGIEYVMEPRGEKSCCDCAVSCDCHGYNAPILRYCEDRKDGKTRYICTSATPVQEEEKVYGSWNKEDAMQFLEKKVSAFIRGGWELGELICISEAENDAMPFHVKNWGWVANIKELPTRRLTKAQIIEAHPDLEGVELVGGWE